MIGSLENKLKEMILCEELLPGERVTEAGLASRLGISRTPVRNILPTLASEGFLQRVGKRGFAVAHFSDREIYGALGLRSALEGWAARLLAERGARPDVLAQLEECLRLGDNLFENGQLSGDGEQEYGAMNARFHQLIIEACEFPLLDMFIGRLNNVPFVAPSVIVFDRVGLRLAFDMLHRAHGFHHAIVDAIKARDGARAEFLFREHANHQRVSMFERRQANSPSAATPKIKRVPRLRKRGPQ